MLFIFLFIFFASCNKKKDNIVTKTVFSSKDYTNLSPESKLAFLDSVYSCCYPVENDSVTRGFIFDLSSEYYNLNESLQSLKLYKDVLVRSKVAADTASMALASYYIADYFEQKDKDSAYHYYLQAEKLYRLLENPHHTALAKFHKAVLLFYEGNNVESEIELSGALQLLDDTSDRQLLLSCYNLMGSNFEKLEDYQNAMRYYLLARKLIILMIDKGELIASESNYLVTLSINIANIYEKTGKYKLAIAELEGIINDSLKMKWPSIYAVAVGNLGYTKMKIGALDGVEDLLKQSLYLSRQHDSEAELLYKLNNLGEYYSITGDTLQSIHYLKQSLEINERTQAGEELKSTLRLLSQMDYKNDSKYKEKYIRYTDSLHKTQRKNRNKFARIEYETAKVEDENRILTTENLKIVLISVFVILALVSLLLIRYNAGKKREFEIKRKQQIADEELFALLKQHQMQVTLAREQEQNRISKELHDGIMNRIYGVRLHLEMLNESHDAASRKKRLKFIEILQDIEKEIRLISHDLHIDRYHNSSDYVSLIADFIAQQNGLGHTAFQFTNDSSIDWDSISGLIKVTIKRVLQEATLNVNKYAEARNCVIVLKKEAGDLLLTVSDDGRGFDMKSTATGIGLKNMHSRAKSADGKISIESEPGHGTVVELIVPSGL